MSIFSLFVYGTTPIVGGRDGGGQRTSLLL